MWIFRTRACNNLFKRNFLRKHRNAVLNYISTNNESAEIKVEEASMNSVTFTKIGKYDNKILTDKVSITINGDNFSGTDELKLDTISDVDGSIRKTETAIYSIKGEKIAGQSVL